MMVLRFTVPGTPHPKARHRYRVLQRKGTTGTHRDHYFAMEYADPDTEREEARIAAYCRKAMLEQHFDRVDSGPVALFVLAVFKIPASVSKKEREGRIWHTQRPDIDNVWKLIADSAKGVAWGDDCQVVYGPCFKVWSSTAEEVVVWVVPLSTDRLDVARGYHELCYQSGAFVELAHQITEASRREQQIGMEGVS